MAGERFNWEEKISLECGRTTPWVGILDGKKGKPENIPIFTSLGRLTLDTM